MVTDDAKSSGRDPSGHKRTVYLIDTENVGKNWDFIADKAKQGDTIMLFYSENSHMVSLYAFGDASTRGIDFKFMECMTGQNAMDFQITAALARASALEPDAAYVVFSKDKGYDPAIQMLANNGVEVTRFAPGMDAAELDFDGRARGKAARAAEAAAVTARADVLDMPEGIPAATRIPSPDPAPPHLKPGLMMPAPLRTPDGGTSTGIKSSAGMMEKMGADKACLSEIFITCPDLEPETSILVADILHDAMTRKPGEREAVSLPRLSFLVGAETARDVWDKLQESIGRLSPYFYHEDEVPVNAARLPYTECIKAVDQEEPELDINMRLLVANALCRILPMEADERELALWTQLNRWFATEKAKELTHSLLTAVRHMFPKEETEKVQDAAPAPQGTDAPCDAIPAQQTGAVSGAYSRKTGEEKEIMDACMHETAIADLPIDPDLYQAAAGVLYDVLSMPHHKHHNTLKSLVNKLFCYNRAASEVSAKLDRALIRLNLDFPYFRKPREVVDTERKLREACMSEVNKALPGFGYMCLAVRDMMYRAIMEAPEKRETVLRKLLNYLPDKYNKQDMFAWLQPSIARLVPESGEAADASGKGMTLGSDDAQGAGQKDADAEKKLRAACMVEVYNIEPGLSPDTKHKIADALYDVLAEAPALRQPMLRERLNWIGPHKAQSISDKLQPAITRLTSGRGGMCRTSRAAEKELRAACLEEVRKAGLGVDPGRNQKIADAMCRSVSAEPDKRMAVLQQQISALLGKKKGRRAASKLQPAVTRLTKRFVA